MEYQNINNKIIQKQIQTTKKYIYIFPEKRQNIIDNLRLIITVWQWNIKNNKLIRKYTTSTE